MLEVKLLMKPGFGTSISSTSSPALSTSTSTGLSVGTKVGIGASIPIAAIALAGMSFWLFLRRKHKSRPQYEHGQDMAESLGPADRNNDADLPELVDKHLIAEVHSTAGPGGAYDSSISANTAGDTASWRTQPSSALQQIVPELVTELDSSQTNVGVSQAAAAQSRHKLETTHTELPAIRQVTDVAVFNSSASRHPDNNLEPNEEIAKLEAEYANVQERRQRLMEIDRLDEEERRLKQRIEEQGKR
jgi:hypothetical protein